MLPNHCDYNAKIQMIQYSSCWLIVPVKLEKDCQFHIAKYKRILVVRLVLFCKKILIIVFFNEPVPCLDELPL